MNDREPFYKLATLDGQKPYADGDRAQATVVKHLQLVEKCRQDRSLIVVDVGAFIGKMNLRMIFFIYFFIGDFGLYAAACGCQVYMFEVQPNMVDLIETSILTNNFSSSRVHIINKAVSNLPSNSSLTFSIAGGDTTAMNGTLNVTTIRLDDIQWSKQSTILLLKIDVEGFELNVLRSAEKLFRENRIQHVIFEYTAWWTDRSAQKELLPFVENNLHAKQLYALHRTGNDVYGPLNRDVLDDFYENHFNKHLQTDIYATFIDTDKKTSIKAKSYNSHSTFA
jgi:FkbM family methyltransferase